MVEKHVVEKTFPQEIVSDALYEGQDKVLQLLETGEWTADGKYQIRDIIFQEVKTCLHWCYSETRSGSPFSDYVYDTDWSTEFSLVRVEKAEKIVTYWKTVAAEPFSKGQEVVCLEEGQLWINACS